MPPLLIASGGASLAALAGHQLEAVHEVRIEHGLEPGASIGSRAVGVVRVTSAKIRWLVTVATIGFVVMGTVGFVLSLRYGMLTGWDEALGPPWVLTLVSCGALLVARRPDRWGFAGTVVLLLSAGAYLAGGQFSEPITGWAFGHHLGFASYIALALLTAAAVVVASAWGLWIRARNGGRLPA